MKFFLSLCCLALLSSGLAHGQDYISLDKGWKFHLGDSSSWSDPGLNDQSWKNIRVHRSWESQGYPDYDGYAWYRVHVTIPSSLKNSSYLKGGLKIELGEIDDGDETFLNGTRVGLNGGSGGPITQGLYNKERIYQLPLGDPAIHWDGDNVIAVRVYDRGGDGGMWTGIYRLSVLDLADYVDLDDSSPFSFPGSGKVSKELTLRDNSPRYAMAGILQVTVTDPSDNHTVWERTVPAAFSVSRPFHFLFNPALPARQSYQVSYVFTEQKSRKSVSVEEGIPYLLTPRPSPKPRINGAKVTGSRPGHPFLFRIPVTGIRPVRFQAKGLPGGLILDPRTGIITGKVDQAGSYPVHVTVSNSLGKAEEDLTILVGDQIAYTPAMGWNSWNCWGLSVSDAKVRASADAMVRKGLVNHGWTYINIDDGWEKGRDSAGNIIPNNKFPNMKGLASYIHSQGLKMGIYSSPGPKTCGGYTGSYQHEAQDAASYAHWGIDYLKYDWCSYSQIDPHPDLAGLQKPYRVMRTALDGVDRDILFSLCQYGMGDVWKWGAEVGGNSWRTTGDINDSWSSLSTIGFRQNICAPYAGPGHWNDPDMLVVGRVGWGPSLHNSRLTPDEQYTHISLWCLLSAPLLIGCDMSQLDDFTLNLLSNDEVIAVDQDALGREANRIDSSGDIQVWAKPMSDGSLAVGLFNLGDHMEKGTLPIAPLRMGDLVAVRDLWRQKDLGNFRNVFTTAIPSHGVVLVRIWPSK
ncbi:MAG TPA: putative Ig domain-containing protein [Chitinophagaceae bacterium]|nr:putative Ig domain-containing protein [Chitinophagaceae bacterium]